MTLKERLAQDLKDAMRAREAVRLGAIRMLNAALLEWEKSGRGPVTEADELAILQKQVKQRRDSLAQFEAAGRTDLAEKEAAELAVLEAYLTAQASDEEIARIVQEVIAQTGAASPKDMGRVMGPAMARLKGQADGQRVRAAVEAALKG
ncbi:MAG TPA: GatB/YqeY domain-containing protein [Rubricoccaceae bacterium]|nr:GatB/YqeY domain-containing protein [Rubricoccaceae bacterium]